MFLFSTEEIFDEIRRCTAPDEWSGLGIGVNYDFVDRDSDSFHTFDMVRFSAIELSTMPAIRFSSLPEILLAAGYLLLALG